MKNPKPMTTPLPSLFDCDSRRVVAMFRSPVFNPSETFVAAQATGLVRYQPLMVGVYDKGNVPLALSGRVLLPQTSQARLSLKLLGNWHDLAARIRPFAPQLLHAQFGPDGALALPLARALGIPIVTSLRGYDVGLSNFDLLASGRLSWIRYALRRRALARRGDLFFAVSEALRAKAIASGFPAARTVTLYNGVDLKHFSKRHGYDEEGVVLHIGRLVEKKGTALLLRAFAKVRQKFPAATLVIIGDGPLRKSLQRQSADLELGDSVRFLGFQPPAIVKEWMNRAAVLAAPSLTARDGDTEGLPNVVVEAAASGLAIVASHHAGIPEAVVDGRNGFTIPEGETELLAHRLADLIGSRDLRLRMGQAGRALAEERFDAVRQIQLLEDHYDALLSRSQ